MRIPHLPKIDWSWLEKLVVVYKLMEIAETMFGFFTDIKKAVADLKTRVEAIEAALKAKVEGDTTAVEQAPEKAVEAVATDVKVDVADAVEKL
jgi:hypothetical protein